MADHAPRYPSYDPDPDFEPYEERSTGFSVAHYQFEQSARTNEQSVPLFLSDADGDPDPSEYMQPSLPRRGSYYTSRILAGVSGCAVLAVLAALASSDAAQDFIRSAKASTTAALFVASTAMQPGATQPKAPGVQLKETVRLSEPEIQAPNPQNITVAAVAPTRDDIKTAYQSALQGTAPPTAAVPETTTPAETIHPLDPSEIAALLKRADTLIASRDVAAARLVLRRAAEAGDASAAMMLAGTYDPTVLEKLGVRGVVPDLSMARSWYEKAKRLGAPDATSQIELLANRQR
jgi:TPR repeat protein